MDFTRAPRGAVIVGVDGSPTSDLALDWAVEEATRRKLPLHIIHAFSYGYPKAGSGYGHSVDDLRQIAHNVSKAATARAQRANPGLADKPTPAPDASVVVGVDGSAVSAKAIEYAYEQASSRGVGLTAVHAWWLEYVEGTAASAIWTVDWQQFAEEEQTLVSELLAGWQEKYPDVVVRRHSVRGLPVDALVGQSEDACLAVVGTRGRGGFKGLLLGSVSQGVRHRAHCPVALVHPAEETPDDREDKSDTAPHGLPVPPVREQT